MLGIEKIDVFIGEHHILRSVSLELTGGEKVAVLGANGAGKTTLIRTVVGLEKPRSGRIAFDGRDIGGLPPYEISRLGIACVPEGRRPFGDMAVMDNLRMGAYNPAARKSLKESLAEVTALFPALHERLHQPAETLSGGEQQMLAIGRALMSRPQLLLVDELSLGLAPLVVKEIYRALRLVGETRTLLIVEQNVNQVLRHTDRAYLMQTGTIIRSGPCVELMADEDIVKAYLAH
ncbi:MAG: ABC transporter ATP-binding protein [Deltaproteobacteria bacterium]|nr:ABC transporter ATP-binding protein [Deltaproteobacteria bacterium]